MPYLIVHRDPDFIKILHFSEDARIGKKESNDLVLEGSGVSREHAFIRKTDDGRFVLYDNKSTNSTWVGNQRISNCIHLAQNQVFRIMDYHITFLGEEDKDLAGDGFVTWKLQDDESLGEISQGSWVVDEKSVSPTELDLDLDHFAQKRLSQILEAIGEIFSLMEDYHKLMERVLEFALEIMDAERGFLVQQIEGKNKIYKIRGFPEKIAQLPISRSIVKKVMDESHTVRVDNAVVENPSKSAYEFNLRSILCAPFTSYRNRKGCIYLDNPYKIRSFTSEDQTILNILAKQIGIAIENAWLHKKAQDEKTALKKRIGFEQKIVFESEPMERLYQNISKIARFNNLPVLILGETGTGKELIAQTIHQFSPGSASFVPINCAAVNEQLFESELFGHVKGAFTGADKDKAGLFEKAKGGTLFLDEIGEMNPLLQAKLLRALQEGEIYRVGGTTPIKTDVRIVAATNRDITDEALRKEIGFRDDLYFRLEATKLVSPPLRDRKQDIPLLVEYFTKKFASDHHCHPPKISDEAMKLLKGYCWPGNVRELQNAVQSAFIRSNGSTIFPEDLHEAIQLTDKPHYLSRFPSLQDLEKEHIQKALDLNQWNRIQTAEVLGISRDTLRRKMKQYRIYKTSE